MPEKRAEGREQLSAQINLYLSEELLAEVEEARWAAKVSRSEWVRQAMREKLAREGKGGGR